MFGEHQTSERRKEVGEITEKTTRTIQKSLHFEESGEILSISIGLENISPQIKADTFFPFLRTMFEHLLKELDFDNSSL